MDKDKLSFSDRGLFDVITFPMARQEVVRDEGGRPVDFRWIDVNSAFEEFVKTPKERLVGRLGSEVFPHIHEKWKKSYVEEGGHCKSMRFHEFLPGVKKHSEINVFGEEENTFTVVLTDVSEYYEMKRNLDQSEKLLYNILSLIPMRIFWKDRDCVYLGGNHAFARDAGIEDPAKLVGLTDNDLVWAEEQGEDYRRDDMEVMYSGVPKINFEERQTHASGQTIWLRTSKIPITNEDGAIIGVLGTYEDITRQKEAEEDIRQKNEELTSNIEEIKNVNRELEIASKKAEESDHLKTAFLANLSHEIRTPMNGILGFSNLLRDSDLTSEDKEEYLRVIETSGRRMLKLIQDLVDISKIESNQIEVDLHEVSLHAVLDEIFNFFRPAAEKRNLEFKYIKYFVGIGPKIMTDRTKLEQILTNLITNALKFTDTGGVEIGYKIQEKQLLFWVSDTGVGIDEEKQESIFIRFMQAETDASRFNEGSGLGLSIAKAFVNCMGGEMWVESEKGKGSTFYFTLAYNPIETVVDSKMLGKIKSGLLLTKKVSILIVEDDEYNSMFLSEALKSPMVKLYTARNGLEAVQEVNERADIDLILMDLKMPQMNGFEAINIIKASRPDLPIVCQSAFVGNADQEQAIEAGCIGYLTKPIDRQELYELVSKVLEDE